MNLKRLGAFSSIGLGLISLFIPNLLDMLWNTLGYDASTRPWLTATVAVLFFVAIPLLILQLEVQELGDKVKSEPDLRAMSSSEAMLDASKHFLNAVQVLNTRIITGEVEKFDGSETWTKWDVRLLTAIKMGTRVREIMSNNCEAFARRRNAALGTEFRGLYETRFVEFSPGGAFVNYVIVMREDKKHLWFGWLISPGTSHDVVYYTERKDLVEMFEQYFNNQFREGSLLS